MSEAVSFLVLLGIAMPLKYAMGIPEPVRYVGWLHGLLFILFCFCLLHATARTRWSAKFALALFIASLIPFAPFFFDHKLKGYEEREGQEG